jgi:hypothetical protein
LPLRAEPGIDSRSPDCGPTSVRWPRGGCAPPVHSRVAALFETGRLPAVARFKFPTLHVPSLTNDAAAGRPGLPTRLPPVRSTACVDDCVTGPSSCRTRPAPTGPTVPVRFTPRVGRSSRVRKWGRVLAARGYPASGPGVTLGPWCPFRRPSWRLGIRANDSDFGISATAAPSAAHDTAGRSFACGGASRPAGFGHRCDSRSLVALRLPFVTTRIHVAGRRLGFRYLSNGRSKRNVRHIGT